jgi:anti-sigma-K factor RskA
MDIQQYITSGIIETYVMGLCTPEEEKELQQLRLQHPALDAAIFAFEKLLEKNMLLQSSLPDEATDMRILKTLNSLSSQQAVIPAPTSTTFIIHRNWSKVLAIAASVLFLISCGLNYYLYLQTKKQLPIPANTTVSLPARDYEVLNNPAITPVAMYGVGSHSICRCTMFWDKKTGKMYIMIHHLPKSSTSKDYQLWASVNGKPVNVGLLQDDIRGRFIELPNVPANAIAFSVTLEKAGGAAIPTVEETYLEGKI